MASPYDSGEAGKELGQLRAQMGAINKRLETLLANDRNRQSAERAAGKPLASREGDARATRRAYAGRDAETAQAAGTAFTARSKQKVITDELAASEKRLAQAQVQSTGALRTQIQQGYGASQELRRRGALTTEAIAAAARGTLTFRELGYQVGATIGKFAGWTLAAGFTFAAVDAISKLGTGALEGAEGVNKLTRVINNVDTSRAHDQIRSLAEASNQDLKTVGEGLFESGKVFNNQDDAEKLTRVALRAKNIGELEVGDAVRFLTSIVRGFKLEAADASTVLDIFNNLQQKFGTDIRGGLQGAAQGAAQVLNAGGSLEQFSALIATIQRAGFSGSEAGVALRRSAELVKRPGGINKERLAEFGIDSSLPYKQIIEQAVQLAESGRVKGAEINELATALVTPQLSPRFAAILNRPDQFRRAERIVSPESRRDSAKIEEQKFLSTPLQQLKAIGVELEKLGDALGEAGAFKLIALMAKALEGSLEAATGLVNVFNELPAPLRQAVLIMGELYAITRLIRRVNPGDGGITPGRLATPGHPSGYFQPSPDSRLRKALRTDVRNETQFYKDNQEQAARRQTDTAYREQLAHQNSTYVRRQDLAAARGGDEHAARRVLAADQEAIRATQDATRAKNEYISANKNFTESVARQAQADKLLRRSSVYTPQQAANKLGYDTVSTTFNTPTHIQPGAFQTDGGIIVPPYAGQSKGGRAVETASKDAVRRSQQLRNDIKQGLRTGNAFQRASAVVAAAYNDVGRRFGQDGTALKSAGAAAGRAASTFSRVGSSIVGFFGPVGLAIAALAAIPFILQDKARQHDLEGFIKRSQQKLPDTASLQAQLDQAKQPRSPETALFDKARGLGDEALNAVFPGVGTALEKAGLDYEDPHDRNIKELEDLVKDAKKRDARRRQQNNVLKQKQAEARLSNAPTRYNPQVFDDTALQGEIDALNTLSGLGRLGNRGLKNLTSAYIEAIGRFGGSRDPEDIQKLAAAQQGFQGALEAVQQNLQEQLDLVGDNPLGRRVAYQDARSKLLVIRQEARRNLARRKRQFQQAREEEKRSAQESFDSSLEQGGSNQVLGSDLGQLPSSIKSTADQKKRRAKKKLSEAEKAVRDIAKELRKFFKALADAFNDFDEGDRFAKFDEQTDLIRQRADVAASGTLNTGSQLAARLNAANQNLSRARSLGSGPEAERRINDAIIERNNIVNEMANLAVQRLEAANQIKIASAPTETARIRAEISAAQAKLALLRSQGRGSEETDTVVADIIRLQKELQSQILEDAKSLAEAVAEYRKSKTANPNREAQIDVGLARRLLRLDKRIEDPTERRRAVLQDRARLNDARGQRRLTGVSERFETIEYKARIGLISGGQELNLIQTLLNSISKKQLRTVDGMRDFYRQLKERMKQLEKESELEINPGSIRLPTLYDVRRLQQQGTNQAAAGVVTQQNNYTFDVGDASAAEALGGVLERIHGSDTTAAMRAAGMI